MQVDKETWGRFLDQEVPWRWAWQLTPVFLPGESRGQSGLVEYSPQGHKEADVIEVIQHTHTQGLFYGNLISYSLDMRYNVEESLFSTIIDMTQFVYFNKH